MITETAIPPNHVVCPRCNGIGYRLGDETDSTCAECYGEGHIMNQLISEWRTSTSLARLIELLGGKADEKRLQLWANSCADLCKSRWPRSFSSGYSLEVGRSVSSWMVDNFGDAYVSRNEVCNIIRCLWPNPFIERERVECPLCLPFGGGFDMSMFVDERDRNPAICWICKDERTTEAPIIDPRWLSTTVLDLANVIWGDGWSKPDEHGRSRANKPRPELMPVLADALLDAGCDSEEVIEHCQSGGPHVGGCWVISEILKGPT